MKLGSRVIVEFAKGDDLEPSPGKVIDQQYQPNTGHLIKVRHDNGQDNWHREEHVSPLLRSVE